MLCFDAVYHGREGVRRYLEQWKSAFGHHSYEVREIADAGGGRFALRFELGGTVGDVAIEVSEEYGNVNTIDSGLLRRQENFYHWEEALAVLAGRPATPAPPHG